MEDLFKDVLVGKNIIVLDLETEKSADDCRHCGQIEALHHEVPQTLGMPLTGEKPIRCEAFEPIGWNNKLALGLSIGCYYDYADGQLHWFDSAILEDVVRLFVDRKPLLVSFNGMQFDFPLMRAILRNRYKSLNPMCDLFKMVCTNGYDIVREIWQADPTRKFEKGLNSLDAISQACGYGAKEMDGATAPRLWAQQQYARVIQYNVGDVLKTKALFERCVYTAEIIRGDGKPLDVASPTLPA